MTIRVGVIGAGIMGADHAAIADRAVSGSSVSVLFDVDEARARQVAGGLRSARVAGSGEALIAADDVDAVIVASSDPTHAGFVHAAIEARKPVLCEKPLAPTAEACAEIVAAADRTPGSSVSVGFMRRFDAGYVELKAALTDGEIGDAIIVHNQSRGVTSGPGATSEGLITGSAVHELDIVPWLLDSPIVEVSWHGTVSARSDLVDPQFLLLRTRRGVLATLEVFLNARYGYDIRCEVVGSAGTRELVSGSTTATARDGRREVVLGKDWRPRFADAYRREQQAWVDGIREGAASGLATARDGWAAARVADAAIEAMSHPGRSVPVAAGG